MPVFTFEKISPPAHRSPIDSGAKKHGGVLVNLLDRLAANTVRRGLARTEGVIARNERFPTCDPK